MDKIIKSKMQTEALRAYRIYLSKLDDVQLKLEYDDALGLGIFGNKFYYDEY